MSRRLGRANSSAEASAGKAAAFRRGLGETGYVDGQNVTVEYHWLEGQFDRVPPLMAELVHRRVAAIATPGTPFAALAAKAATPTIPIVFGAGEDPVRLGLVTSLARPGGNATGSNFFSQEMIAKRLGLLHEPVPKAVRVAVLVNPANAATAETTMREAREAARAFGLQIDLLNATTIGEIDAAFATFARERPDALFVAADGFVVSRRVQFATLAARERIPAAYGERDFVAAGGLMSYRTSLADMHRDLPVIQLVKFELVINTSTARMLGLTVPPILSRHRAQLGVEAGSTHNGSGTTTRPIGWGGRAMLQLDRRALAFGCAGAVIGAAIVATAWVVVSMQHEPEPAWRQTQPYDECLAYGRSFTTCDAIMRVIATRNEQARREAEEERAQTEREAGEHEEARRDSERACLEQSGVPDHPVAKLACAAQ